MLERTEMLQLPLDHPPRPFRLGSITKTSKTEPPPHNPAKSSSLLILQGKRKKREPKKRTPKKKKGFSLCSSKSKLGCHVPELLSNTATPALFLTLLTTLSPLFEEDAGVVCPCQDAPPVYTVQPPAATRLRAGGLAGPHFFATRAEI